MRLVLAEQPPIGTVVVLGQQVWLGWLMLAALVYADAEMNRADRLTAGAARDRRDGASGSASGGPTP